MSGGSMNYLYTQVESAPFQLNTHLRRAFNDHLKKVALALHAIEWNDSGDGHDKEEMFILDCIKNEGALERLLKEAKELQVELSKFTNEVSK